MTFWPLSFKNEKHIVKLSNTLVRQKTDVQTVRKSYILTHTNEVKFCLDKGTLLENN